MCAVSLGAAAQSTITYPYNPDGNADTLIGGMANEATWRGYHRNNAIGYANSLMIEEGKEMDYFANPSYKIYETPKAFGFGMKYVIDADAIGVRVSEGLFVK